MVMMPDTLAELERVATTPTPFDPFDALQQMEGLLARMQRTALRMETAVTALARIGVCAVPGEPRRRFRGQITIDGETVPFQDLERLEIYF